MTYDIKNLSRWQRFNLWAAGFVKTGSQTREGWSGALDFYVFRCPYHGLVEDYAHGYERKLQCPICDITVIHLGY